MTSLPLWDDLIECFPPGVHPTDVDGMVELGGHILLMEEKPTAGADLPNGQRKALVRLSDLDGVTVVFWRPTIGGKDGDVEVLILAHDLPKLGWRPVTREWLKAWLVLWVEWAEASPKPRRVALSTEELRSMSEPDETALA